ncbi:Annexin A1 [Crenichthys baileyi]|uniref:Annexin n=1 Tax=Crenichthys baileyi TaxID=28760 RepID=A0AAV9QRM1_9TELE
MDRVRRWSSDERGNQEGSGSVSPDPSTTAKFKVQLSSIDRPNPSLNILLSSLLLWALVFVVGLGTDEDCLIEILASRTNKQILDIKKVYKEEYKKDLEEDIRSDTSGDFRAALLVLCKAGRTEGISEQLIDSDARTLYEAGEGRKGKDCSAFIDILTSRSAPHLRKVFDRYSKYSKVDVAKAIDLEMKGDIESCLTALVKCAGSRPAFFAEKLYLAMKGKGTRKHILTRIMVSRSEIDMKRIKDEFKKNYGKTLYQDILDDTNGDYEKILLALCGGEN